MNGLQPFSTYIRHSYIVDVSFYVINFLRENYMCVWERESLRNYGPDVSENDSEEILLTKFVPHFEAGVVAGKRDILTH